MYDIAIIGAGPAGLTAGIYGKRAGLSIIIFEKAFPGGQMNYSSSIENYPGFESISGIELSQNMRKQIDGVDYKSNEIVSVDLKPQIKRISTKKEDFFAKNIIIATGGVNRKLGLMAEEKFVGRGVSYCATCDGAFFKNKTVMVVGGGNTALDDCLYLSNFAKTVLLVHRREEFRADKTTLDKIREKDNVVIYTNSIVTDIIGEKSVSQIEIENVISRKKANIPTDGLFIAIGYIPNTEFVRAQIKLNDEGYIIADKSLMTNINNVYAAGDCREKGLKQVVTACNDGAICVSEIGIRG